jgi:uncharacterized protein (UPF0335 family)
MSEALYEVSEYEDRAVKGREAPAPVGHNSGVTIAADRLRSIIERVERLDEERKALSADIRDIFTEAKSSGFVPKVVRQLIALRKIDKNDREEQEELLDVYRQALGEG